MPGRPQLLTQAPRPTSGLLFIDDTSVRLGAGRRLQKMTPTRGAFGEEAVSSQRLNITDAALPARRDAEGAAVMGRSVESAGDLLAFASKSWWTQRVGTSRPARRWRRNVYECWGSQYMPSTTQTHESVLIHDGCLCTERFTAVYRSYEL